MITLASQWNEYRDHIIKPEQREITSPMLMAAEMGFYAGALRVLKLINDLQRDTMLGKLSPEQSDDAVSAWLAEIGVRNEAFGREADL